MRVDHRGHGIRGIVETVDELEAMRDQQRDKKQQIGQKRRGSCAGGLDIRIEAVGHVEQTAGKYQSKMIAVRGSSGRSSLGRTAPVAVPVLTSSATSVIFLAPWFRQAPKYG